MMVRASVDAETGEIILAKKPWWAFMAKEMHASDADIEADVGASTDTTIKNPETSVNATSNASASINATA